MNLPESKLVKSQKINRVTVYKKGGIKYKAKLNIRHDDECGNGHNTFSVTVDVYHKARNNRWIEDSFGCQHDLAVELWPDLEPLIKWHLTSTDGPLHYIENTLFHAGDKDCWGKRKGEPKQWEYKIKVGNDPVLHTLGGHFVKWIMAEYTKGARIFDVVEVPHREEPGKSYKFAPKYTFKGYRADLCEWYQCPFDTLDEAKQWESAINYGMLEFHKIVTAWGKGSEPDLEAARDAAIWPDATLDQLRDRDALEARLPGLMVEFKRAVESLGMVY